MLPGTGGLADQGFLGSEAVLGPEILLSVAFLQDFVEGIGILFCQEDLAHIDAEVVDQPGQCGLQQLI